MSLWIVYRRWLFRFGAWGVFAGSYPALPCLETDLPGLTGLKVRIMVIPLLLTLSIVMSAIHILISLSQRQPKTNPSKTFCVDCAWEISGN